MVCAYCRVEKTAVNSNINARHQADGFRIGGLVAPLVWRAKSR
jgi:hypothetical protein